MKFEDWFHDISVKCVVSVFKIYYRKLEFSAPDYYYL